VNAAVNPPMGKLSVRPVCYTETRTVNRLAERDEHKINRQQ
jgi:hypothetical protein